MRYSVHGSNPAKLAAAALSLEEDESKRLRPTSLGRTVSDMLIKAFPDILEVGFTAPLEVDLDKVEEGTENWVKTMKRFYGPFAKDLADAKKKMPEVKHKGLATNLKCELDGGDMVIKWGRNGEFLACSNYPKCTNTGEIARDEARAVALDHRRGVRQPRGERRDARLDEVVHVLRPQHEEVLRQVAARQRGEESAGAGLGTLEGETLLEKLARAQQSLCHARACTAAQPIFTRALRVPRCAGRFDRPEARENR